MYLNPAEFKKMAFSSILFQSIQAGQSDKHACPGTVSQIYRYCYSCLGASTGQTLSHAPQSIQTSGSITYLLSPCEIAETGHSLSHAPQEMHSSLILYAMGRYLHDMYLNVLYHKCVKNQRLPNQKFTHFAILTYKSAEIQKK